VRPCLAGHADDPPPQLLLLLLLLLLLQLLAVNTSKAKLHLPADAVFEDYLAAEYEADAVRETFLDPMAPPGVGSSRSDTHQGQASTSAEAAGDSEDELSGVEDPTEGSTRHSSSSTTTTTRRAVSAADREGAAANEGGRLLKARCWMAEDFPMHLNQLLPLLDVIGTTNKHMAKVGLTRGSGAGARARAQPAPSPQALSRGQQHLIECKPLPYQCCLQ
jgi:hypothetical protein